MHDGDVGDFGDVWTTSIVLSLSQSVLKFDTKSRKKGENSIYNQTHHICLNDQAQLWNQDSSSIHFSISILWMPPNAISKNVKTAPYFITMLWDGIICKLTKLSRWCWFVVCAQRVIDMLLEKIIYDRPPTNMQQLKKNYGKLRTPVQICIAIESVRGRLLVFSGGCIFVGGLS